MEDETALNTNAEISDLASDQTSPLTSMGTKGTLLKRSLDIVLSSLMMILSLPFSLPIALAIKLEDRGPVFYLQKRWGRGGTRFKAYKFRTMVPNSDRVFGIKPAEESDHRITRVGKVLRAMGLDELPQILNIFLGDMSFVGPRSLAIGEIVTDRKAGWYNTRMFLFSGTDSGSVRDLPEWPPSTFPKILRRNESSAMICFISASSLSGWM